MQQKTSIILALSIILIAVGVWFFIPMDKEEKNNSVDNSEIIARVNGKDVTRGELEAIKSQIASGQGTDSSSLNEEDQKKLEEQALNALVSDTLIRQAVEKSGITASEEDIENQIKAIKAQFENEEKYQEKLSEQSTSEEQIRSQVAESLAMQAYLEQNLDLDSATVSEEEIKSLYEGQANNSEDLPPLEQVQDQIKSFILQQKQQELLSKHVEELRKSAEIEILI